MKMIEIKSLMTEKVLQTILNNYKMALNVLQTESFDVYNFIKEEFQKTDDVTKNHLFQFVYRSFYRLDNAGLTPELKTKYFDLLQEYRNKDIDLKNICLDLYEYKTRKDKNSIQFSFVTKLANTIDSSYPIYDSEVIKLFDFKQPYYLKEKNSKIDKYLEQYQYILFTSNELIKNEKVLSIFNEMNELFGSSCINMSNSKKLDTLMWGVGKVMN
jgi:hypothetical protein